MKQVVVVLLLGLVLVSAHGVHGAEVNKQTKPSWARKLLGIQTGFVSVNLPGLSINVGEPGTGVLPRGGNSGPDSWQWGGNGGGGNGGCTRIWQGCNNGGGWPGTWGRRRA